MYSIPWFFLCRVVLWSSGFNCYVNILTRATNSKLKYINLFIIFCFNFNCRMSQGLRKLQMMNYQRVDLIQLMLQAVLLKLFQVSRYLTPPLALGCSTVNHLLACIWEFGVTSAQYPLVGDQSSLSNQLFAIAGRGK